MADNRTPPAVAPVSDAVRDEIHYDSLWATARDALALYSGQTWTARGDDDPGITLMQAFAYGVSDISYRHTLPLVDLLQNKNPAISSGGQQISETGLDHRAGIFAHEFGPELALTSSPVTLEDYRRGIYDLTVSKNTVERFCFRDVQIARLTDEVSYSYVYNQATYSFEFASDSDNGNAQRYRVRGGYGLWVTLNPDIPQQEASRVLDKWLTEHRNLCEFEISKPEYVEVKAETPAVRLILDDELSAGQINQAVARAVWAMNQVLLPAPERQNADARLGAGEPAEQVYLGPCLTHGWLVQLPPVRDITQKHRVSLQALSAAVTGTVAGVNGVEWTGETNDIDIGNNEQKQLWTDKNGHITDVLKHISLYKRGQDITATASQKSIINAYDSLSEAACRAKAETPRSVPYGRNRHPEFYRSVGAYLPPVYGLQQGAGAFLPAGDNHARNLWLFLRCYEQLLANSAHQLSMLPDLLTFDGRSLNSDVWGAAYWPDKNEDPLTYEQRETLLGSQLLKELKTVTGNLTQDKDKELDIISYLLGYFGETRAAGALRVLQDEPGDPGKVDNGSADFVAVQQGFLRQVTRLAYARAAISISKVSALQRKIAARLGVGKDLFSEVLQQPGSLFPTNTLPFYIIEHQELLPRAPAEKAVSDNWPENAKYVSKEDQMLKLKLDNNALQVGQLIDLKMSSGNEHVQPLMGIVIHGLGPGPGEVTINLDENVRLRNNLELLKKVVKNKWKWRVSRTWLRRVVHALQYVTSPKSKDNTATLKVDSSFPSGLKKGDRFALRPRGRWLYQPTITDLTKENVDKKPDVVVEVIAVDPVEGTVTVSWCGTSTPTLVTNTVPPVDLHGSIEKIGIAWPDSSYAWSAPYDMENFSFTLSVVLSRALLNGGNPHELSKWIETIVREEMPSHLNLQLHWISDFSTFALRYGSWQDSGHKVGDKSYELLRLLGIGERPVDLRAGIGYVRVATDTESARIVDKLKESDSTPATRDADSESVIYVSGNSA